MPFSSRAQAKWMFANHPEMAKEWADETPSMSDLPEKKDMATMSTFGNMLNQKTSTSSGKKDSGLGGMRFRGMSFGQETKRNKANQPLNLWAKMLDKESK